MLDSVIVSADAFQVYRGFGVASDKIADEEMAGVPHYGIDLVNATDEFTVKQFLDYVLPIVDKELADGRSPIIVGGTHMYVEKLLFTSRLDETEPSLVATPLPCASREYTHAHLMEIDPESASRLHPNDVRRVSRAIDYYYDTGTPLSVEMTKQKRELRWPNVLVLCKRPAVPADGPTDAKAAQSALDAKIRNRIQTKMIHENRLMNELLAIGRLLSEGKLTWNKGLLQAIGYREFEPFLTGFSLGISDVNLWDQGVEEMVRNTVRYSKKQTKWINKLATLLNIHYVEEFDTNQMHDILLTSHGHSPLKSLPQWH